MVALETYSTNVTVAENTPIPLNNVALSKGCEIEKQGSATIQFNKCGAYRVNVNCVATASEAGNLGIQLQKDGVLQPQAVSGITATETTSLRPMSFETFVQVSRNNSNCCCVSPVTISIINTGVEAIFDNIDVTISKEPC